MERKKVVQLVVSIIATIMLGTFCVIGKIIFNLVQFVFLVLYLAFTLIKCACHLLANAYEKFLDILISLEFGWDDMFGEAIKWLKRKFE